MPQSTRDISWLTARPIAHRGLHDRDRGVIENTASAFAAAIDGNYAIECDLQLTRDGEAVVFHDEVLDRLTTSTGWVKDLTVPQMKALAIRGSSDHVQTLTELLSQVAGRVPLVIEIKTHWDGDERLTLKAIDVLRTYQGPYCIMSFDPDVLRTLHRHAPEILRGFVADGGFDDYYDMLPLRQPPGTAHLRHLDRSPTRISFPSIYDDLPWAHRSRPSVMPAIPSLPGPSGHHSRKPWRAAIPIRSHSSGIAPEC